MALGVHMAMLQRGRKACYRVDHGHTLLLVYSNGTPVPETKADLCVSFSLWGSNNLYLTRRKRYSLCQGKLHSEVLAAVTAQLLRFAYLRQIKCA